MNNKFFHITVVPNNDSTLCANIRWHSVSKNSYLVLNDLHIYYPVMHKFCTKGIKNTKVDTTFYHLDRYVCDVQIPLKDASTNNSFYIFCDGVKSKNRSFKLSKNLPFNFFVLTDLQPKFNNTIFKLISILKSKYKDPSMMICSGDLVDCAGSEEEFSFILDHPYFNDQFFISSVGDHEYWADDLSHPYPMYDRPITYNELFNNPKNGAINNTNFYFEYNNCLFVFLDTLDSNHAFNDLIDAQAKWFKEVIFPIRNKYKALFVFMHKSIMGSKLIDASVSNLLTPIWKNLFEEAHVSIVFSGHDHIYSRSKSINHVIYLDMESSGEKRRDTDDSLINNEELALVINLKEKGYSCAANVQVSSESIEVEVINDLEEVVDKIKIDF